MDCKRPPPCIWTFCQCGVFVHVLDFNDSLHHYYICVCFAGNLFISLVSEAFMECKLYIMGRMIMGAVAEIQVHK